MRAAIWLLVLLVLTCCDGHVVVSNDKTIEENDHMNTPTHDSNHDTRSHVCKDNHHHHHDHQHIHDHQNHDDHSGDHHAHHHDSHSAPGHTHTGLSQDIDSRIHTLPVDRFSPAIWAESLFATALVGAAPVFVLYFVPLGIGANDATQKSRLRTFLSFAAGGLLGDALLHLLPHSIPGHHEHHHNHDHSHDDGHAHTLEDLSVWLWTIIGIISFLMLEKMVRARTGGGHSGHGHSHEVPNKLGDGKDTTGQTSEKKHKEDQRTSDETSILKVITPAGYLNLAADFSHNFTDGLAIGATFLRGSGWRTTFAMLLHELPHEIGDFAILIQSGFTRREAMYSQFLTAVGAMVGTVVGLLMEGSGGSTSAWISPFTAGGFIYIACVSVMPELLEDCSLRQSIQEGASMCLGVGLMIVIALNE